MVAELSLRWGPSPKQAASQGRPTVWGFEDLERRLSRFFCQGTFCVCFVLGTKRSNVIPSGDPPRIKFQFLEDVLRIMQGSCQFTGIPLRVPQSVCPPQAPNRTHSSGT
jgi:hypothetical protein